MIGIAPPAAPKISVASAVSVWQGPADEDMFRAERLTRRRKATAWLGDPATGPKLDLGVSLLQPALSIIGSIFLAQPRNISALDFAAAQRSPATRAMDKYSQLILTEGDPFWLVYNRGEWTMERYRKALHGCLALMGHIFLRMVLPFQAWPWPLAELASQKTSQERRDAVADCFWAAGPCCLDTRFSQPFKAMVQTRAGVT